MVRTAESRDEADKDKVRTERAQGQQQAGTFFSLIYNELHRDAATWFDEHGWDAQATLLADYFVQLGQPAPEPETEAGQMLYSGNLVTAAKR
jgi:hypothetical protein